MFKTIWMIVVALGLAIASPGNAMSTVAHVSKHVHRSPIHRLPYPAAKQKKVQYQRAEAPPMDDQSCLREAIIFESRGIKSTDTRVYLARSILSRVGRLGFPPSVCQVTYQKTVVPKQHKVIPQFTWSMKKPNVKLSDDDLITAAFVADKAFVEQDRYGPINAVYFSSNGTCPVPAKRRFRKGPFTFCEPKVT